MSDRPTADTLDVLVDRAARGVLLRSEGPALRAAVAKLQQHLAAEHQTSALRAGIANDLRAELAAAKTRIAELSAGCGQLHGAVHQNRERAEKAEAQIAAIRALHHDDYGLCHACTSSHGVPWPCPTITALDGAADACPSAAKVKAVRAFADQLIATGCPWEGNEPGVGEDILEILDGPRAPAAVKATPLMAVSQEDMEDWTLSGPTQDPS